MNKDLAVVIPTRNRIRYLRVLLSHIFSEPSYDPDFADIIVLDNNCTDGTKGHLANLSAVKVLSSTSDLSMADNWKRIIPELSNYKWCIFIGDDDCLMPGFFEKARNLITSHQGIKIFSWRSPSYRWPTAPSDPNTLMMQTCNKPQLVSSEKYISACFGQLQGIMAPPGFYHSICDTSLINDCIHKYGEFDFGHVPDFGSGILFMSVTNEYYLHNVPLSVMGFGSKSTGASFKSGGKNSKSREEFIKLTNYENDERLMLHPPFMNPRFADVLHLKMMNGWQFYFSEKGFEYNKISDENMIKYLCKRVFAVPQEDKQRFVNELVDYAKSCKLRIKKEVLEQQINVSSNIGKGEAVSFFKDNKVFNIQTNPTLIKSVSDASYLIQMLIKSNIEN